MLLDPFRKQTYVKEESIYGFGPWVVRDIFEGEGTWQHVVNDWMYKFNQLIIENVVKRNTVVQAGSWQGVYPFLLSNMFDRVYTFEPDPVNFFCTTMNCQRNNIFKFQCALSDHAGVSIFEETGTTGQGRLESINPYDIPVTNKFQVSTIRLDDLALDSCDLILLDVENHEYQALYGGQWTIKKYQPAILLERNFKDSDNERIDQFLRSLGYSLEQNIEGKDLFYLHKNHIKKI